MADKPNETVDAIERELEEELKLDMGPDPAEVGAEAVSEEPDIGGPQTASETVEEALAEEESSKDPSDPQVEIDALKERHLRLAAEFKNFRRRAEAEMTSAWSRAQADLIRRLLDALDDLERVSDLDPETTTVEGLLEGVELVERKMIKVLQEVGAEAVSPVGEPFDPNTMEAMMRVPVDSEDDDDTVHQVFQKGYVLKGHLVRPARVSVKKFD